ncbi:E3 ubiquitin protein ligase UPL3-like protein [Tanacetum coccineum]
MDTLPRAHAVVNLLEIMGEFNADQQRAICQFVTGAPRLFPGGLAVLNPKLMIVRKVSLGSLYIKSKEAPAKDILKDLVEMCHGIFLKSAGISYLILVPSMKGKKGQVADIDTKHLKLDGYCDIFLGSYLIMAQIGKEVKTLPKRHVSWMWCIMLRTMSWSEPKGVIPYKQWYLQHYDMDLRCKKKAVAGATKKRQTFPIFLS